jgi:hypothetical protein
MPGRWRAVDDDRSSPEDSMRSPLYVLRFQTFIAFDNIELNHFAFVERFETLPEDGGVVHENVLPGFLNDEAESLLVVEPLDLAAGHILPVSWLRGAKKKGRPAFPPFGVPCQKTNDCMRLNTSAVI